MPHFGSIQHNVSVALGSNKWLLRFTLYMIKVELMLMNRINTTAPAMNYLVALMLTTLAAHEAAKADRDDNLEELISVEILGELDGSLAPARVVCDCYCVGIDTKRALCVNKPVPKRDEACDKHFEIPATPETKCRSLEGSLCKGYTADGNRSTGAIQSCVKIVIAQQ